MLTPAGEQDRGDQAATRKETQAKVVHDMPLKDSLPPRRIWEL